MTVKEIMEIRGIALDTKRKVYDMGKQETEEGLKMIALCDYAMDSIDQTEVGGGKS